MAVVVDADKAEQFMKYAAEENLEATKVAEVTDTNRVRMHWRGKCILDLSRDFLNTNGAQQFAEAYAKAPAAASDSDDIRDSLFRETKTKAQLLTDLNCCSKKGLIERFDSTIGASTVLMPLGGKYQLSPAAGMAAKLPVTKGETDTATIMAYGFDPQLASASPFHGALYAVIDSVTKIAAMGGDYRKIRLTFQEYFEKLGEDPARWGKPMAALLGALRVQQELEIPAIGGKDSMSGTFMDIDVPPTLASFAITAVDADDIISTEFKEAGSHLVLVTAPAGKDGIPDFDIYRSNMAKIRELAAAGKILAADTVGRGGIYMTLVKMAVGNGIGADAKTTADILAPLYGSVILEIPACENARELMSGAVFEIIGKTTADSRLTINGETEELAEITACWQKPLEGIFPVRTADFRDSRDTTKVKREIFIERNGAGPAIKTARPKVIIPAFPGTNCEVDSARAFERAGAEAEIQIIRNLTTVELEASIYELESKIRQSQMIMIPGGFSGGDEPDGSAKFITAVFRNPAIADAVTELLEKRDGLMLGICNGFQALIKLGLVPYGKITEATEHSPTLTYNRIGRHASCLVRTGIASVKSPWLAGTNIGDIYTIPVSHGEGRFIAEPDVLESLRANGQIATQYVDYDGEPSMDIEFNPNGSVLAIEGITSPDGRVFGKMGHSERIGKNVYKNVAGEKDMKIFESGVKYFR